MKDVLELLMTGPLEPAPWESMPAWWQGHCAVTERFPTPAVQAIAGGFAADRLAWAFASGYQAALCALVPSLGAGQRLALAATEEGGAHPKAIVTSLRPDGDGFLLDGRKTIVTAGSAADVLVVIARIGHDRSGRPVLRAVSVPSGRAGVVAVDAPPLPFAPELPHAALELASVHITRSDVLDGDGYDRYLKPFRTLEDCHVHGAVLGYLFRLSRLAAWPMAVRDELLALAVAVLGLSGADPTSPAVQIAVAAAIGQTRQLIRRLGPPCWERIDPVVRQRWERDRPLLDIAGKARTLRLQRAMERLCLT